MRHGELLQFDVADKEAIKNELGGWIEKNSDMQSKFLVNNAGIRDDALMLWMKDDQWETVIRTSLDGFFYVTRLVLNGMLQKRYGRIINIVSLSGIKGMPGQVNYSAAKAGVIGATKALAQEVGRRDITVNAIAPGFIKTDMTKDLDEGAEIIDTGKPFWHARRSGLCRRLSGCSAGRLYHRRSNICKWRSIYLNFVIKLI